MSVHDFSSFVVGAILAAATSCQAGTSQGERTRAATLVGELNKFEAPLLSDLRKAGFPTRAIPDKLAGKLGEAARIRILGCYCLQKDDGPIYDVAFLET